MNLHWGTHLTKKVLGNPKGKGGLREEDLGGSQKGSNEGGKMEF